MTLFHQRIPFICAINALTKYKFYSEMYTFIEYHQELYFVKLVSEKYNKPLKILPLCMKL